MLSCLHIGKEFIEFWRKNLCNTLRLTVLFFFADHLNVHLLHQVIVDGKIPEPEIMFHPLQQPHYLSWKEQLV